MAEPPHKAARLETNDVAAQTTTNRLVEEDTVPNSVINVEETR